MKHEYSPEHLENILGALNNEKDVRLDDDAAAGFLAIAASLGRYLVKENRELKHRVSILQRQVDRMREKMRTDENHIIEEDAFPSTGLSDKTVALAVLYKLQEGGFYISQKKYMLLLYMVYASFLFHTEKTLCVEVPTAIADRPMFWAAKNISVVSPVDRQSWKSICDHSPAVAAYLEKYLLSHGNASEEELANYVCKSTPFKEARRRAAAMGKKAARFKNRDIYLWKAEEKKI